MRKLSDFVDYGTAGPGKKKLIVGTGIWMLFIVVCLTESRKHPHRGSYGDCKTWAAYNPLTGTGFCNVRMLTTFLQAHNVMSKHLGVEFNHRVKDVGDYLAKETFRG